MNRLPLTITPCPLVEATFEIRFNSSIPSDAIFGVLYNEFKEQFPVVESLPILQLPEAIRSHDPNLKYSPHYRLPIEDFVLQIGPSVFSLSNVGRYIGWSDFSKKIIACYEKLTKSAVVNAEERIALRYINIFHNINIFENSTLSLNLPGISLSDNPIHFVFDIPIEGGGHKCVIANHAQTTLGGNEVFGSVIDIDTHIIPDASKTFDESLMYLHEEEKMLFYKILSEDYLKKLNPCYNGDGENV